MLLWKLLVVADLLILASYIVAVWKRHEHFGRSDYLTVPIGAVGTAGLITYAFSLPTLSPVFWRIFLPVLAVSGAWEMTRAVNKEGFNLGTAIGGLIALALVGFTSIALFRLGGSHWVSTG